MQPLKFKIAMLRNSTKLRKLKFRSLGIFCLSMYQKPTLLREQKIENFRKLVRITTADASPAIN